MISTVTNRYNGTKNSETPPKKKSQSIHDFKSVHQEVISVRGSGHLYVCPSVHPSVCPYVRLLCLWKKSISWLFLPWRNCVHDQTIDAHNSEAILTVTFARNSSSLSVCLSVNPSVSLCLYLYRTHVARNSLHTVTRSRQIVGSKLVWQSHLAPWLLIT